MRCGFAEEGVSLARVGLKFQRTHALPSVLSACDMWIKMWALVCFCRCHASAPPAGTLTFSTLLEAALAMVFVTAMEQ